MRIAAAVAVNCISNISVDISVHFRRQRFPFRIYNTASDDVVAVVRDALKDEFDDIVEIADDRRAESQQELCLRGRRQNATRRPDFER